ncbi:MAG: hypothetical protein ACTH8K_10260, partial [Microbacterium gubbeenense]|uniref:hypothetical protein n=1 Tax=Microbacterium gubbeenense TaxID=159896 RepID=UPI003F9DC72B
MTGGAITLGFPTLQPNTGAGSERAHEEHAPGGGVEDICEASERVLPWATPVGHDLDNELALLEHVADDLLEQHLVLFGAGAGEHDVAEEDRVSRPGVCGGRIPWKDLSHGTSQQIP